VIADAPGRLRVIRAARGPADWRLDELWEHRELLWFLVWRDVKLRYKQTALGVAWAILQPLLGMALFTVIFGRFARMPSDGAPYALFAYAALVPWTFFATSLTQAANSVVGGASLVTKVYFPRVILPLAAVASPALDLGIALVLLALMMAAAGVVPTGAVLLLPLFLAMLCVAALGAGLWLAALNVEFRDVRYVVPFLIQLWLFATPVVYPSSLLPGPWRAAAAINPMAGVVDGVRGSLLGTPLSWSGIVLSMTAGLVLFLSGVAYFRRVEDRMADRV
jgi:lipopolysaccharide transport system permease protein